jgi:hypothetical protein
MPSLFSKLALEIPDPDWPAAIYFLHSHGTRNIFLLYGTNKWIYEQGISSTGSFAEIAICAVIKPRVLGV